MVTSEQMRRLEKLEVQARATEFEQARHDPEFRAQAAEYAARFDLDVDELIEESLEIAQRIAVIGQDAWEAECLTEDREHAERLGMTLDQYRARDLEAEWREWKEFDRARRAEIVHWQQGVMYRGGVPVTE